MLSQLPPSTKAKKKKGIIKCNPIFIEITTTKCHLYFSWLIQLDAQPGHLIVYPGSQLCHIGVGRRNILGCTLNAPRDDARQLIAILLPRNAAEQRRTTVTLARVLALNAAGAEEARVQSKTSSENGATQQTLALLVLHNGQINALQYVLQ